MSPPRRDQLSFVPMDVARSQIKDSDLLLWRRRGLISIAGRGEHTHGAKAAWWGDDLMCLEVRQWYGGRIAPLENLVQSSPGQIDVFRANSGDRYDYDREAAVRYMCRFAGRPYGYRSILWASCLHLAFVRLLVRANTDDEAVSRRPPFCTEAIVTADRLGGGVDPVPNLADRLTEPADLARSQFYEQYLFTLVP